MTISLAYLMFGLGIVALWIGGEGVVRSIMTFAKAFRVEAFILSLTLLAIATSGPELFFNIFSSLRHQGSFGLGNILGANITNFALIFAIATLFVKVKKRDNEAIWAYPSLLAFSLFFFMLGLDGTIDRIEGGLLVLLFVVWIFLALRGQFKKRLIEKIEMLLPQHRDPWQLTLTAVLFVTSLFMLFGGAEFLVRGVTQLAQSWQVSGMLLAALLVSLGTTMPELATAAVAVFRKRYDIRSGTLFGSNIVNLSLIVGINALIYPITFPVGSFVLLSILILATSMFAAPIIFNFKSTARMWSIVLFSCYIIFILYTTTQLTQ